MTEHPVPRATYRLQITSKFTFADATRLVPYLSRLGISHVYLSPILKARRGSTHGYDTVDHRVISPELGGEAGFRELSARLREHRMGIVLDIVPNHMGVGGDENDLWLDLLEWGERSRYADWFDVNWHPSEPSLHGKVLVPFLGRSYGKALTEGGLELRFDTARGEFAVWAEEAHKLPLCPATYADLLQGTVELPDGAVAGEQASALKARLRTLPSERVEAIVGAVNASPERLHQLIEKQHWRPARYSFAADDINYRRFFIVSDLAGIRIERDDVFEHVHRIPLQLVAEGLVDGLRVDHIDGLKDPKAYCLRLRERCARPVWIVVEKILAPHEQLRADWGVDGTTGYEFATAVNQLLTDSAAEPALTALYEQQAGLQLPFARIERHAKLGIIDAEMPAELDALAMRLHRLAAQRRDSSDITRNALRSALRAYVAALPVYRTYVDGGALADADRRNIGFALAEARAAAPEIDPQVFAFLERVLLDELCRPNAEYDPDDVRDVAQRIQQYTGPVMAKGLEDTALYRYHRLVALSDVGAKPDRFSCSIASFHDFCRGQQRSFPNGLLTTSSHDTKRGEDTRARIAALSGCAAEWGREVGRWNELLDGAGAPRIGGNDRYEFYQLLLGAWPTTFDPLAALPPERLQAFTDRLDQAMLKSIREARQHTNWTVPRSTYEEAVSGFVMVALDPDGAFLPAFRRFERRIAPLGAVNGLIELVLKLTTPGVPDIYQGAEFWDQSLVDPDNRRPVDFAVREAALAAAGNLDSMAAEWRSGRIKQAVLHSLLTVRGDFPALFRHADYVPLEVDYPDDSVLAFLRQHGRQRLLVCVRLHPWRSHPWEPATLHLEDGTGSWRAILGEVDIVGPKARVRFDRLPFAIAIDDRE